VTVSFRVAAALLLLVSSLHSQPVSKAAPDRNAFTFLNWNLDLRLETKAESLFSRGKIMLRNDSATAQTQIALQISSSLKWASIKENGAAIPFFASQVRSDVDHSGNVEEAVATLSSPVEVGGSVELEVAYSGTVSLDTTRLAQLGIPLEVRAATDYDRITPTFTCLRGVGHVLWFPASLDPVIMGEGNRLFDEISAWQVRHSSSSMTLSISSDLPPLLHTNAQFSLFKEDGAATLDREEWKHLGIAGPVVVGGDYQEKVARQDHGPAFFVLFLPEHEPEADDYARVVRDTLPTVTGKSEFPVSMIQLPEAQDATFDADTMLLTPLKTIDRKSLELTIAFMLAHQSLWSSRAWIYEGAAHLAQVLMRERQDGRAAAIAYMKQRLPPLTIADSGTTDNAKSASLVNTTNEVFFRTKAMYVWWMLREIVGERTLLDSLQQYDPASDKEPSYIQKLLEKNSHKDLEWFFDDWVYQDRGLPEFTISNGYARRSLQGIYLVSATIENKGGAAAEVPVIVHTENGDVVTRLRVPAHGKTAARVEVNSRPIDVTVNDGSVPEIDRSDNTTPVKIAHEEDTGD
jgi:hypothetical protein